MFFFFFSSRRRHTRSDRDWSSDVCSSDLTGHSLCLSSDGKAMVLRCDKYLPCREITYWMVAAAVAIRQFDRLTTQREPEQLMTEANPKDRYRPVRQIANRFDGVSHRCRIARAVGQEDAVRLEAADGACRRCRRHHRHFTSVLHK